MTSTLSKRFARKLRLAREQKALPPEELARRVGVSSQSVSSWLAGKTFPKPVNLERLAECLGRPLVWFFEFEDPGDDEIRSLVNQLDDLADQAQKIRREISFRLTDPSAER